MIEVDGFHIISYPETSVGTREGHWKISGVIYFKSSDELEIFRNKLKDFIVTAFDISHNVEVFTNLEYRAEEKTHEDMAPTGL